MKRVNQSHWLRWIVGLLIFIIFGLYIGLPVGMAVVATFPSHTTVGTTPDGFQPVTLTTDDNVTLAGWYAPPANRAVIILLHGAGASRDSMRSYAEMLVNHGYGVLTVDLRGHGQSGGKTNRLGWEGTLDVGAAIRFLQGQPEVQFIGGLGLSLGGEVLLGAASAYPDLKAIVADGATRRSTDELLALPSERSLVRSFTTRVMFAAVQFLSGDKPPSPPLLDSMVAAKSTQFLLIAASTNAVETDFNQVFAEKVGERAELWVVPDASHTGAFSLYPAEYEQLVIAFFDEKLLVNPATLR